MESQADGFTIQADVGDACGLWVVEMAAAKSSGLE